MQKELDLLLPLVKDYKSRTVNDITLYEGQMGDNSLTIMQPVMVVHCMLMIR